MNASRFVDEHVLPMGSPVDAVWAALLRVLRRDMGAGAWFARVLGCDPAHGTPGFTGRPGETVPGFRIVNAERGRLLALRGRHRFAQYTLTFVLDGGSVRARTDAAFVGLLGTLYRAAVITSGGHRHLTRRLLRRVVREARERSARA